LKDSVSNSEVVSSIHQQQRIYEISKKNQQIEELEIDRQIKENTIHYQRIIQWIIIVAFILAIGVILVILHQKKKLRKAYNVLFEKNVEIIEMHKKEVVNSYELQDMSLKEVSKLEVKISEFKSIEEDYFPEIVSGQKLKTETLNNSDNQLLHELNNPQKLVLSEQAQKELLSKILSFMENSPEIFSPKFSIDELVISTHSNKKYVSYVINNVLKKNFNTFLNGYRIREAQRLFHNSDTTVEYVANKVGYLSRNSFYDAFKTIIGVTPGFYIKSLHGKEKKEVM